MKAVALNLENAVKDGDAALFTAQMNADALFSDALSDLPATAQKGKFLESLKTEDFSSLAGGMSAMVKNGGTYKWTGLVTREEERRAIMRFDGPNGLNYHELSFTPEGKIDEIYFCSDGTSLGETYRDGFIDVAKKHGLADVIGPKANTLFDDMTTVQAAQETDDVDLALTMLATLSPDGKKRRSWMMSALDLSVASEDPEDFKKQWAYHQKTFPNDAGATLTGFFYFLEAGELEAAMQQVDALDKIVGGDDYLDMFRGNVLLAEDDWENAIKKFSAAARAIPESVDPLIGLFDALVALERVDKAVNVLKFMDKKHGVSITDRYLSADEMYADLLGSDAYKRYRP